MADNKKMANLGYSIGDRILGRYQVRQVCGGEGCSGMGIVYIISDEENGLRAMKTFQPQLISNAAVRESIRREAEMWLNLGSHPNIVHVETLELVSTQILLVMEYIAPDTQGRNCLANFLQGRPLNERQVSQWASHFCLGMIYAQSKGILCHRDVKPSNLLIGMDGILKISDFGLAVACENTSDGTLAASAAFGTTLCTMINDGKRIAGTPVYMSPEMLVGDAPDIRSDVYAFGLVLHQMVTGLPSPVMTVPWKGDVNVFVSALAALRKDAVPPLTGTAYDPVIARCLAPDPSERYQSFRELGSALVHVLGENDRNALSGMPASTIEFLQYISARDQQIQVSHEENRRLKAVELNQLSFGQYCLGRFESALDLAVQARELDSSLTSAWIHEGIALTHLSRYDEAMIAFDYAEKMICKNRSEYDPAFWHNKGALLRKMNLTIDALRCFENCIELDPRRIEPWHSKGNCLSDLRRYNDALDAYEQAIRIDPNFALIWTRRADMLMRLGRLQDARQSSERALGLDPDSLEIKSFHNQILAKTGGDDSSSMIADDKPLPQEVVEQAEAFCRMNRLDKALEYLEQYLQTYDSNSLVKEAAERLFPELISVRQAELDLSNGNYEPILQSESLLASTRQEGPLRQRARRVLCLARNLKAVELAQHDNFGSAKSMLKKAIELASSEEDLQLLRKNLESVAVQYLNQNLAFLYERKRWGRAVELISDTISVAVSEEIKSSLRKNLSFFLTAQSIEILNDLVKSTPVQLWVRLTDSGFEVCTTSLSELENIKTATSQANKRLKESIELDKENQPARDYLHLVESLHEVVSNIASEETKSYLRKKLSQLLNLIAVDIINSITSNNR